MFLLEKCIGEDIHSQWQTPALILAPKYTPSKEIQESFNINCNPERIQYVGVAITKALSKLYIENYKINQKIQEIYQMMVYSTSRF